MASYPSLLVHFLATASPTVAKFMPNEVGWPFAEAFTSSACACSSAPSSSSTLRLLGLAKRIPIAALHKLIPFGLSGLR